MPKIVLKNQYFDKGDGSKNFLVNSDWSELEHVPNDVRVWIPARFALDLVDEHQSAFYEQINSGRIECYRVKANEDCRLGTMIVPLFNAIEYGIEKFQAMALKQIRVLEASVRKTGWDEAKITETIEELRKANSNAIQSLREGRELLLKGKGRASEAIVV